MPNSYSCQGGTPWLCAHPASFPLWRARVIVGKVSGRKTFGVVDTLGLLVAVVVMAANVSDNVGGMLSNGPGAA